jgi:hypothetical protein
MINRLLYWIASCLPCRIISEDDQPYLERYFLCELFGLRFCLHRFVASDPDRGLHDHPHTFAVSLILSGYYYEQRRGGVRQVCWLNVLTADTFHRVILPPSKSCWTLFVRTKADAKRWGFWHPNGADLGVWRAYVYEGGATVPGPWWERVPLGRDEPRRQPIYLAQEGA